MTAEHAAGRAREEGAAGDWARGEGSSGGLILVVTSQVRPVLLLGGEAGGVRGAGLAEARRRRRCEASSRGGHSAAHSSCARRACAHTIPKAIHLLMHSVAKLAVCLACEVENTNQT
jgi:hypothetical protein